MDKNILIIIGIVLFIVIINVIVIYNKIVKALVKVEETSSGIDVALNKRHDLLTKMIDVVKGYAKYEQETLFEIIKLREKMNIEEKTIVSKQMDSQEEKINALVENYPDLKASENFMMLQKAIADAEEHIQASRRLYNNYVAKYNQLLEMFPSNIIAKMRNDKKKEYFMADIDK